MKVVFAVSECYPFIKTGGLADVAGALPKACVAAGVDVSVILPLYQDIPQAYKDRMESVCELRVPLSWRKQYLGIKKICEDGVTYYFFDNLYYFGRKGLYGFYDDAERFAFFSRAVLEALPYTGGVPDILHCNDWQTGMISFFLNKFYRGTHPEYDKIRVLFSIHNLEYQGAFPAEICEDVLGLDWGDYLGGNIRHNEAINYMKTGIVSSSWVNTVSPTYAREIQTPAYGHSLDGLLCEVNDKLSGILNGIDTTVYNPMTDKNILVNYSARSIARKAENKKELQRQFGLLERDVPVLAIVSRLAEHKGIGLIAEAFERLMDRDIQLVVLGTGEWQYQELFERAAKDHPGKVAAHIGFDAALAQKIYAGADGFLMPSVSEPCGLSQMIALRYGTIPVVHKTGGLADSVIPFDAASGKGLGIVFEDANADALLWAVDELARFYADKDVWNVLVQNAMKCDYSWKKPAKEYIKIYKKLAPMAD